LNIQRYCQTRLSGPILVCEPWKTLQFVMPDVYSDSRSALVSRGRVGSRSRNYYVQPQWSGARRSAPKAQLNAARFQPWTVPDKITAGTSSSAPPVQLHCQQPRDHQHQLPLEQLLPFKLGSIRQSRLAASLQAQRKPELVLTCGSSSSASSRRCDTVVSKSQAARLRE